MTMNANNNYEHLDIQTLTNLLTNPDNLPEVHEGAFHALAKIVPDERRARMLTVAQSMLDRPEKYDSELMVAIIEIYATDPHPDATAAMLELLPKFLESGARKSGGISPDVRRYFYEALVTRSRPEDLMVWGEWLPTFDGKALVAMVLDPHAKPLEALEPITLIDRLAEPERTRALISVIAGLSARRTSPEEIRALAVTLQQSHDPENLARGVKALAERWKSAQKSERPEHVRNLETALAILDSRPRNAIERMRGQRPWAE